MTRKQLPFFAAFIVLLFGAMACACLGSGVGIGGFQATANAAFTQASSAAATGAAESGSLAGTAEADATNSAATEAAAGSNTNVSPTAASQSTVPAQATEASSGGATQAATESTAGGGTASGGPSDIPIIKGDNTILLVNSQLVSYQTKSSFADTVAFYKGAMPSNGWTEDTTTSMETQNADVLVYTKANRKAQVSITSDPSTGQTVVLITIQ